MKSEVLLYLQERGFIKDCTNLETLDNISSKNSITVYAGYDLTADSLHAGNLMTLMMLRAFQKFGHNVITLLGGATTKIGDPTGRDSARPILSDEKISQNMEGISSNFGQIFPDKTTIVNNYDWLSKLSYIDFLQHVGRHFTLDRMSAMDSVTLRMQKGITLTELNYMTMQAYDFLHLYRNHNCSLQIGGSDQWGNIVQGVELIRRTLFETEGKHIECFGLTCPLISRADGAKMGKSADGAVWLSPQKLSHFDYFQYFRNIPDADVSKFLKFFTELPLSEVFRLEKLKGKEINEAKKILAFEATRIIHGEHLANEALKSATEIHEANSSDALMETVQIQDANILDAIIIADFAKSKGEAKKLIAQNAVKVNNKPCVDSAHQLQNNDILQIGKKKFVRISLLKTQ